MLDAKTQTCVETRKAPQDVKEGSVKYRCGGLFLHVELCASYVRGYVRDYVQSRLLRWAVTIWQLLLIAIVSIAVGHENKVRNKADGT